MLRKTTEPQVAELLLNQQFSLIRRTTTITTADTEYPKRGGGGGGGILVLIYCSSSCPPVRDCLLSPPPPKRMRRRAPLESSELRACLIKKRPRQENRPPLGSHMILLQCSIFSLPPFQLGRRWRQAPRKKQPLGLGICGPPPPSPGFFFSLHVIHDRHTGRSGQKKKGGGKKGTIEQLCVGPYCNPGPESHHGAQMGD